MLRCYFPKMCIRDSPAIEESATFTDADWAELGKRGFKVREARASTGKLNGYYAVSYTHLDVYKRQATMSQPEAVRSIRQAR